MSAFLKSLIFSRVCALSIFHQVLLQYVIKAHSSQDWRSAIYCKLYYSMFDEVHTQAHLMTGIDELFGSKNYITMPFALANFMALGLI